MDLNGLQTFVQVVRAGGFSAAGRQTGLPRSTVSLRVRMLEDRLGVRLFKRSTRAIALTVEGRALYAQISEALDTLAGAADAVRELDDELRGPIRVTAPADFPANVLAEAIGGFRELHRKVTFEVILTNRVLDLVADNIDVALRMGVDDAQTMVHRCVARFAYGLFASPAYLAKLGGIAGTDEVADFIAPPKAVRDYLASSVFNGVALPAVDIEANNYLLIRDLAVAGRGVGLMPAAVCASDVAEARLRPVLPDLIAGEVAMVLSFPARADISGRVRDFADHLARHLAV